MPVLLRSGPITMVKIKFGESRLIALLQGKVLSKNNKTMSRGKKELLYKNVE